MYAEDALLVPPQADMRMGRKDIQAFWIQQAKQAEGLSVAVLDVKPLGPDAARAVVRGEMTTRGDKPRQLTGRNVVVLQKVGADWKLTTHIWNYGAESGPVAAPAGQLRPREPAQFRS
jgi:ketosteroid isomerase-like protein